LDVVLGKKRSQGKEIDELEMDDVGRKGTKKRSWKNSQKKSKRVCRASS